MEVIYILLPAALIFAAGAVAFFAWATRSGQFDDLETPALRLLTDELEERHAAAPKLSPPRRA